MEERIGPLTFISNFDAGNLARVEKVKQEEGSSCNEVADGTVTIVPDYDYNVWTAPDCAGTDYENGNRTWFYFGVKGGQPSKLLRINIMNLNRQGKLYGQGMMTPLVKVVPSRNKWERIRDKPKYETEDGQFKLSFTYRFPDQRNGVCYFAFCYPYSYSESQAKLEELDHNFSSCKQMSSSSPRDDIYYHRELLCYSLDHLRVDLLTITSAKGILESREDWLPSLFPEKIVPRARRFQGKKVFFLSARVHPGETPSSFVFNGFLDFILRRDDPRAAALRNQFVFKMIPMLNPDGVKRGHYRTDTRGVNLNRVYLDPDPLLHPSIFAAKSVIVYHHNNGNLDQNSDVEKVFTCNAGSEEESVHLHNTSQSLVNNAILDVTPIPVALKPGSPDSESVKLELQSVTLDQDDVNNNNDNMEAALLSKNVDSLALEDSVLSSQEKKNSAKADAQKETSIIVNQLSNESTSSMSSDNHSEYLSNNGPPKQLAQRKVDQKQELQNCCNNCFSKTCGESSSGVAYYVDLHGHASKRGCFVYANYLDNEDDYVRSILFPKLISLNSANFDFAACNFTEKNMYSKDKRDGMSKEGSGRVAIYKATGIVHSYTLECNYNCGRMVNCLPPATCDSGRATPPPSPGFPPKYTPDIYEEVGRALAVAVLDMNNSNPWSRLPLSEFSSLEGVRNWIKRFVRSSKNAPSVPKKLSRVVTKTSSMVAGATAGTRQKLAALTSSSSDMSSDNNAAAKVSEPFPSQNGKGAFKESGKKVAGDTSLARRPLHLAATRHSNLQTTGNMGGKNQESSSLCRTTGISGGTVNKDHLPEAGAQKSQVYKPKEQPRVSLELPKTGPTLRLVHNFRHSSQVHVQHVSPSSKTLSPPIEVKMSTVDVHKQFIGFQKGKASTVTKCSNGHFDEDKKKKIIRQRRKNGRKKDKTEESSTLFNESQPVQITLPGRPVEEEVTNAKTSKDEEGFKSKGPQLSRQNSSKNVISCSMMSCEVVDIKELPHSPPPSSSSTTPLQLCNNMSLS